MSLDLHQTSGGIYIERIPATFTKDNIVLFHKIRHNLHNVPRIRFRVFNHETSHSPVLYHPYIEHNPKTAIYEWTQIQAILDTFVRTSNELL